MTDATNTERLFSSIGMFTDLEELVLLSNWSMNKHREDIADLESSLFTRKKLYKAVAEGLNPTEIMRAGALEDSSVSELMRIASSSYFEPYYRDGAEAPVYEEARTRALIKQISTYADKLRNNNGADTNELIDKIKRTEALISGENFKPLATNYGANYLKELEEIQEESNPRYGDGFRFLDKLTSGLHRGQLTVIGARPRIGKSAIALQIAYNVASRQGYKTLFLPLEMTVNECIERLLLQSQIMETDFKKNLTEADKRDIIEFCDMIEKDLKFCEALNRLEDIEKLIKAEKPYLVIIDQLSQIRGSKKKDLRESYIEITRNLKRIALETNTAIILLSQINRANADSNRPSLEALSESDSIGQDADNVMILYTKNDEEEQDSEERLTYLHLVKQRNGKSGVEIPLMYRGERFTFSPVDLTAE